MTSTDRELGDADVVAELNAAFYAAVEAGDLDRMGALWDLGEDVCCVHLGWPLVRGRGRVLRSWAVIMANTAYLQFFPTSTEVSVTGDVAVVACEHSLLVRATDTDTGLGGDRACRGHERLPATRRWLAALDTSRFARYGSVRRGGPHVTDTISLQGLRVRGFHGVLPEERAVGQLFVVDVELYFDTAPAAASDELASTVDYSSLAHLLAEVIGGPPVALIETLAQKLADVCLGEPLVNSVKVTVHKPDAPVGLPVSDVTVTILRERP